MCQVLQQKNLTRFLIVSGRNRPAAPGSANACTAARVKISGRVFSDLIRAIISDRVSGFLFRRGGSFERLVGMLSRRSGPLSSHEHARAIGDAANCRCSVARSLAIRLRRKGSLGGTPQSLKYGNKTMLGVNLQATGASLVACGCQLHSLATTLCSPERMSDDDDL